MKNIKIKKTWLYTALVIIAALFLISQYNKSILKADLKTTEHLFADSLFKLEVKLTKANKKIYTQNEVIATQEQAIKSGLVKIDELEDLNIKRLKAKIKLVEELKLMEKKILMVEPKIIYIDSGSIFDPGPYVKIPVEFYDSTEWSIIDGQVIEEGVEFDQITMYSKPSIYIGKTKEKGLKNLFKRAKDEVVYSNENPYVRLNSMQNITIQKKPKKWYQTNLFKYTLGGAAGAFIYSKSCK